MAFIELFQWFLSFLDPLRGTWIWPGLQEVGGFLGTHLISGMLPAFFIAAAIAVFLDKQRITKLMGADANPLLSYPIAALSGGILTVCSCGVIPIFVGILNQGAGIGPAFTFLMASPAVNLLALTYTYTLLGTKFMIGRGLLVFMTSIIIGFAMKLIFQGSKEKIPAPVALMVVEEDSERTDLQLGIFFAVLIFIMLSATGVIDGLLPQIKASPQVASELKRVFLSLNKILTKLLLITGEIVMLAFLLWRWFSKDEIILWLRKTWGLFVLIFPKVLFGIFLSGLLTTAFPLVKFMSWFDQNTIQANFIASILGSMMYFGTIIGVNIVATLTHYGMHNGPALALLLSAPAVSLPSIIALVPLIGKKRAIVFLVLVIVCSALSGWLFGFWHPPQI